MKTNLLLSIGFALVSKFGTADNLKNMKAHVDKAVVYLQGAEIKANYTTNLLVGSQELIIEGVSPYTDANSIVVQGKGNFIIIESRFEAKYPTTVPGKKKTSKFDQQILLTEDSLALLKFDLEDIQERRNAVSTEKNILLNHRLIKGDIKRDSIQLLTGAMEYLHIKLQQINEELAKIKREERIKNSKYTLINVRLAELKRLKTEIESGIDPTLESKPDYCIIVNIQSDAAGPANLELSYFTQKANWQPYYEIKSTTESASLNLVQKAIVHQNSGIEWKDCWLTLSTASPAGANQRPYLNPIWLSYVQRIQQSYNAAPSSMMKSKMEITTKSDDKEAGQAVSESFDYEYAPAQTTLDYTEISEHMINVDYDIKLKYSIASDNQPHQVLIQQKDLKSSYAYYAVPKMDKNAFLLARVTNWEELNLIPGTARVYMDGTFVSESYLDPNSEQDTLEINLGRDRNVEVKRTRIKSKEYNQVLNDKSVRKFGYELVVRNPKTITTEFIVQDQIPVTSLKEIEIDLKESSGAELEKHSGILTWKFNLKSKENKKLQLVYDLRFPSEKQINGLAQLN